MSSSMAGAKKEQPRMSKNGPRVGHASGQTCSNTEERVAVWDAVAAFVHKQLLVQQGVWIPTFGSFISIISKEIRMEDRTVTLCWPVFHLASILTAVHHVPYGRESLPAHRKVEPLKCSQVVAATSVSRRRARACIQSTVSLLSSCLQNEENIAVVLKDVGVLFIDGLTFQMKFYHDFLEKLSGKANFRRAVRMAPSLLDMGVSRVTPVASLVFSGCLVVLPKFQIELVPKLPPLIHRKSSRSFSGARKPIKDETLPPHSKGKKGKVASSSFPQHRQQTGGGQSLADHQPRALTWTFSTELPSCRCVVPELPLGQPQHCHLPSLVGKPTAQHEKEQRPCSDTSSRYRQRPPAAPPTSLAALSVSMTTFYDHFAHVILRASPCRHPLVLHGCVCAARV
ncbi:LOW QUALITY PROTEIN: uncharacterized protein LOC107324591 [Coturnix japonica]|uniref:LOW QUALITY PROTEIN: uncharacterized protein LOC107324591 n=1 Tax=Coturnix japonica TaxID=93934 RepID=UPI0013A5F273|nr:LOW QUALITY PROTEIN: uncharacterized protein LOC107324591 [Coturnix japonica]